VTGGRDGGRDEGGGNDGDSRSGGANSNYTSHGLRAGNSSRRAFRVDKMNDEAAKALKDSILRKTSCATRGSSDWETSSSDGSSIDEAESYDCNVNANANNAGEEKRGGKHAKLDARAKIDAHAKFDARAKRRRLPKEMMGGEREGKSKEKTVRFSVSRNVKVIENGVTKTVTLTSRVSDGICVTDGVNEMSGGGNSETPSGFETVEEKERAKGVASLSAIYTLRGKRHVERKDGKRRRSI